MDEHPAHMVLYFFIHAVALSSESQSKILKISRHSKQMSSKLFGASKLFKPNDCSGARYYVNQKSELQNNFTQKYSSKSLLEFEDF